MKRTNIVTAFVALLAATAMAAIVGLEQRANANHKSEVRLAELSSELQRLQSTPFRAQKSAGGDPVLAGRLLREGKAHVRATLEELGRDDAPNALVEASAALTANFAVLDRIYVLGATGVGDRPEADRLGSQAAGQTVRIAQLLDEAADEYGRRHGHADAQATLGGVGSILALLLVFAFFYRRAAGARAVAETLARENLRLLAASREEALTDALTGLRNRRALVRDLQAALTEASDERRVVLALFDLDGFKQYNDTFGHPAGDTLLGRLGERLALALEGAGTAYRMGGDEFCVLADGDASGDGGAIADAAAALAEAGEGFAITCSHGTAIVPLEARTAEDALRLADQRLYEHKNRRTSSGRQTTDALLQVLAERQGLELEGHLSSVASLARLVAERLGLPEHEVKRIRLAAELHDVGKTAVPDAILNKAGRLDEEEWDFIRRHTVIGERILLAAPSLADTAKLVRASHESVDGSGYPDALVGPEIPLGARIIAACDAFDAMVSPRPYRNAMSVDEALLELRRCAGPQFDPGVVDIVCALVEELRAYDLRAA